VVMQEFPDELIDQLLAGYQDAGDLTGPEGLINQLRKRLIERAASAELSQHLGYASGGEPPLEQQNRRNGASRKTLRTVDGPVTVELPRDRDASFEPRIVPKHARSFDGFDEQILALYAGGMTTRDIQRHLGEIYSVEVSEGLISEVTSSIQDDVRAWQSRPLEEVYVVVYLDAMMVSIREQQAVKKRAVHVAIGVTLSGERECLGLWVEKTEGARFWTSVMTELKNRGVRDILFVCTDGLSGFPEAIDAVFPLAVNQTCVVHLGRFRDPRRGARGLAQSLGALHPVPRVPRGNAPHRLSPCTSTEASATVIGSSHGAARKTMLAPEAGTRRGTWADHQETPLRNRLVRRRPWQERCSRGAQADASGSGRRAPWTKFAAGGDAILAPWGARELASSWPRSREQQARPRCARARPARSAPRPGRPRA
jgi:mutator family transposase